MKKNVYVILAIVTFVLLTGCSKDLTTKTKDPVGIGNSEIKDNNPKDTDNTSNIESYYPFEENVKYTYSGVGNEYAAYSVYVDYLKDDRQQIRVNNGGTEMVKVLQIKDGELKLVYSKGESYYREDVTSKVNDKSEVLLKEPLTKGNSWTLLDGSTRSITNVKVSIKTPLGSYECIEVTTVRKESTVKDYYAANIGLVKTLFTDKETATEVSSSLSKIDKNVPFTQTVKFYYPNGNDSINYITNKVLSFNTNDVSRKIFEKHFKETPDKDVGVLISSNTTIKSLYLNKDNMVYVDFSKEFTKEMNAGSGYESQILQCITNTLGDYYMVQKVYITVEGEPYSSGHILMKKGEAFIVDHKNSK
jgi:hypothetical protein